MELSAIQSKIYEIRGVKVMLDFDLAGMYQVETRRLNESVKRNIKRFPPDFMFQLTNEEFKYLMSQIAISNKKNDNSMSQIVISRRGGTRKLPYAFTEQGVAMLSSLLNSDIAIAVNIIIMRAFVTIRQLVLKSPIEETKELQYEVKALKQYIKEAFEDYNDINEDTRMELELINETLAELQSRNKLMDKPRRPIGFVTRHSQIAEEMKLP